MSRNVSGEVSWMQPRRYENKIITDLISRHFACPVKIPMPPFQIHFVVYEIYDNIFLNFNYFIAVFVPEKPTVSIAPALSTSKKDDPWPAIILGIIFSVFVLILIISLFCFLRATGRLGGYREQRNQEGKYHMFNDTAKFNAECMLSRCLERNAQI